MDITNTTKNNTSTSANPSGNHSWEDPTNQQFLLDQITLYDQFLQNTDHPYHPHPQQVLSPQPPLFTNNNHVKECEEEEEEEEEGLGVMKEMMYKIAAMQPVDIDPATIRRPARKNVRISDDPQSVAARHRRERISQRMRILQRLVPGGTKMDTASMLEEAARYVKFLKRQVEELQSGGPGTGSGGLDRAGPGYMAGTSGGDEFRFGGESSYN